MTKDAHYEKSSQQSSKDLTKYLADLIRGRNGHKPEQSSEDLTKYFACFPRLLHL